VSFITVRSVKYNNNNNILPELTCFRARQENIAKLYSGVCLKITTRKNEDLTL
jgi:hypothetical protein